MDRRPPTLIVARDAGAANALIPVGALGPAEVIGYGHARRIFEREHVPCGDESATARATLESRRPKALLTGTSLAARLDAEWWGAARSLGIPSVGLVDHWWNLAERFTDRLPFDGLPDVIAVIDEVSRDELEAQGCGAPVEVTGHPGFDALIAATPGGRDLARTRWGVTASDRVVLFASEPIAADIGPSAPIDESEALRILLDGADGWTVVVRPHPREDPAELLRIAGGGVLIEDATPRHAAMAGADAVVGISSIFLVEAALAGRHVLSLDRNVRGMAHRFPLLIAGATDVDGARSWLLEHGSRAIPARERRERIRRSGLSPGSADRVWKLLGTLAA